MENKVRDQQTIYNVRRRWTRVATLGLWLGLMVCVCIGFANVSQVQAGPLEQHPTVSMPTVTGTPRGAYVTVPIDQKLIYVRSGPGRSFPVIGIMVTGESAGALALSEGGEWVQVIYIGVPGNSGWVYSRLVNFTDSETLREVDSPPTPTPNTTPTLPAGAERFAVEDGATPLPTYTPAPAVVQPTFAVGTSQTIMSGLPVGFIIIGLAVLGGFGILLSILRGR